MLMGLGSLATFFVVPSYKTFNYLALDPELHRKRPIAVAWTAAFAAAALVVLAFIRFPLNVRAEAIMQPKDRWPLYATSPGFLDQVVRRDGEAVHKGDPLLVLKNDELAAEIVKQEAGVRGLEVEYLAAQADGASEATMASQKLAVERGRLGRLYAMRDELTVRAPDDGRLIAPMIETKLGSWVPRTDSAHPLGEVARNDKLVGYAVVDQAEVELIRAAEERARAGKTEHASGYATRVRLVGDLAAEPASSISTQLLPAGSRKIRSTAMGAAGGGEQQVDPRDQTGQQLVNDQFEFEVNLNNPSGYYQPNQRAYVRIQMDQGESVVWQAWRRLNQMIQTTKTS